MKIIQDTGDDYLASKNGSNKKNCIESVLQRMIHPSKSLIASNEVVANEAAKVVSSKRTPKALPLVLETRESCTTPLLGNGHICLL